VVYASTPGGPEMPILVAPELNAIRAAFSPEQLAAGKVDISIGLFPLGAADPAVCDTRRSAASLAAAFGAQKKPVTALLQQWNALGLHSCDNTTFSRLPSLHNRVLYLHGSQDFAIPVSNAYLAAAQTPGAWVQVRAGGGHGVAYQYPAWFTSTVAYFLDTVDPMSDKAASYQFLAVPPSCPDSTKG
jgi:pimeloyl-ACP methyl ester carboxylesterase